MGAVHDKGIIKRGKGMKKLKVTLVTSILVAIIFTVGFLSGALYQQRHYPGVVFPGQPWPVRITVLNNLFPEMLIGGEYHYIYWVKDTDCNNSTFPTYSLPNGEQYIDLGIVPQNIDFEIVPQIEENK